MKKTKKLLVTLLVLTFVLSTFSVGFAADAEEKLPSEVVRAQALGILKGDAQGNLNLDKPITRAEALALIIRISGLEKSADLMTGQTKFADANADPGLQWATGYINLGVGQDIVNGYPDGTFKGNAQVTYAEMAKMVLYAMNYGVTVEGGQWPAAVMGKADDLDVFDKVNALPNVPALRGDVVKMLDNSLTINHLKQTGYGDFSQYEEDEGVTFLSKMDVDELEDVRVTEIARVNDKLDDNEVELTEYDKNGKVVDSDIYTLIADVSAEEIFGLEVDAWVNDDDEVFFVKVTTSEKDILFDTVDYEESDDEEITLKDADKTYDWDEDAVVYVNFKEVKLEDIGENAYGKIVLDRGDVAFANLFDFEEADVGVVIEVDEDIIEYVHANADETDLDLDDYDDVYVYNPDFSKADVEDIDVDSAIFFWEGDDDDIYIIVKNETVKGEVERVKEDKIKVDGKEYSQGSYAIITLDKGDNYDTWQTKNIELVEDFVDEEVILVLDLRGRVLLVTGAAKSTSGNMYGIVTYARDTRNATLTVFTKEDKEVEYKAESRTELRELAGLDFVEDYAVLKYKLNSDGEIAEDKATYAKIDSKAVGTKFGPDKEKIHSGQLKKEADKKVVKIGSGSDNFYITKDTVVMKALKSKNIGYEIDPEIIKTDKLISIGFNASAATNAVIFVGKGSDADFIVFLDEDFTGAEEDLFYGVVTDGPWKSGKNFYAEINVFGEGIKEYKVSDEDDFKNGKVVAFDLNNKDEAVYRGSFEDKNINNYKDGYLTTTDAAEYKVDSSAVIYNLKSSGKVDKKIALSKLNDYKSIRFMLDENKILVAATVSAKVTDAPLTPPETEGTVTYINGTDKNIVIDDETYALSNTTILRNEEGTVIAVGATAIDTALTANDTVKDVVVENGIVKSMVGVSVDTEITAAQAVIDDIDALDVGGTFDPSTDGAAVVAARTDYDALTASQQDLVTNIADLETAELEVAEETNTTAAQAVIDDIDALDVGGTFDPSTDGAAVAAARTDYDALTAAQQALVTNIADLETAEDAVAAQAVIDDIDALDVGGTFDPSTDGAAVVAARTDYDALTAAQQALVTNIADLETAELEVAVYLVQNAGDKYEMKTVLEENAELLGLDTVTYDTLSATDKLVVAEYVFDQLPLADETAIGTAFDAGVALTQ